MGDNRHIPEHVLDVCKLKPGQFLTFEEIVQRVRSRGHEVLDRDIQHALDTFVKTGALDRTKAGRYRY